MGSGLVLKGAALNPLPQGPHRHGMLIAAERTFAHGRDAPTCFKKLIGAGVALEVVIELRLPPMLGDELISVEEQKDAARDARRDQRQLNGIEAQIAVVNAGSEFWGEALKWGRSRELLTPTESGVLQVAARMPQRTPTEKQSAKAVEVLGKLQSQGYQAALGEGS